MIITLLSLPVCAQEATNVQQSINNQATERELAANEDPLTKQQVEKADFKKCKKKGILGRAIDNSPPF